jgi:hypothetical protein
MDSLSSTNQIDGDAQVGATGRLMHLNRAHARANLVCQGCIFCLLRYINPLERNFSYVTVACHRDHPRADYF